MQARGHAGGRKWNRRTLVVGQVASTAAEMPWSMGHADREGANIDFTGGFDGGGKQMRSVIARIGVILTVWTACVVWFSVSVLGGAAIHVEEPIYDFGAVIDGTVVEHFFEIENHGDEDLVIEDVRVGCGCTIVELPMRRLIPRRSVRLGVSLSTSGYAGLEVSKSVYLTTNDPAQPQLTLTLQGRIVPQEAYLIEVENLSGNCAC